LLSGVVDSHIAVVGRQGVGDRRRKESGLLQDATLAARFGLPAYGTFACNLPRAVVVAGVLPFCPP
jgi:hypothetical protein